MSSKEKQSKVGRSTKLRGQQTGFASKSNQADQNREAKKDTPALRGRRKQANEMFADDSKQQVGSDGATPRSNTPSIPAAMPTGVPLGETGGERAFKQRQKRRQSKG
jgi:hypothetical protein